MDDAFRVYVEQLRNGHVEKIDEVYLSDFLDIQEKDLSFYPEVYVKGEAYLAEDELLLNLEISAVAKLPCSICNEPLDEKIHIQNFYFALPLAEIKGGVYNMKELLRETILLEVPSFAECGNGHCPKRQELAKYLKEPSSKKNKQDEQEGFHPFAKIEWDDPEQTNKRLGV